MGANFDVRAAKADALGARRYLQSLPFVDGRRIGVVGFSRGGIPALDVVTTRRGTTDAGAGFRAAIIFYAFCSPFIERAEAPALLLLGQQDNVTRPTSCLEMARRLQAGGGAPVDVVLYPTAQHAFDDKRATSPYPYGPGTVMFDAQATSDSRAQVRTFLARHLRP
jgi:dienelactone hydrolase